MVSCLQRLFLTGVAFLLFCMLFLSSWTSQGFAQVALRVIQAMDASFYVPSLPSALYWVGSAHVPEGAFIKGAKKEKSQQMMPHRGKAAGDAPVSQVSSDDLDDYDTQDAAVVVSDPFEKWNRFWFSVNDRFYIYVADPLYRGWMKITPKQTRWALKNFFHNALFPVRFVNNLLQFKFKAAGVEFSRFMMDTMSSAGFSNPSKYKKTIVEMDPAGEDFGQTLGVWGVGNGPYIVWPLIGPSTLRDTIGRIGDIFADPFFYVQPWWASYAAAGTLRFNDLDEVLPLYKDLSGAALDPYISMRDAYINYRQSHVTK